MAGTYTTPELTVDVSGELRDLLTMYADQRAMFTITARNITDEQARERTTVSELTIGGIIKHVTVGELGTAAEIVERDENASIDMESLGDAYTFGPDDTLDYWLAEYARATAEFERVVAAVDSLDELIPQPTAPWQPETEWLSVRQIIIHRLRETAHHCGHLDIIREALDGQTTMAALIEGMDIDWGE